MKLERTKNAARNIAFDGILEMMNMLFPFVIRSVMLHYLGTEYLGLIYEISYYDEDDHLLGRQLVLSDEGAVSGLKEEWEEKA